MSAMFSALWAILMKAILENMTGLKGYIGKYALQWGGQALADMFADWERKHERQKVQQAEEVKYEKVKTDPKSTAAERAKAYEDYINSGR